MPINIYPQSNSFCDNGDRFSYYSQPVVIRHLKHMGIDLTKATVLRFVQNGYIFAPRRRSVVGEDGRIYYNPLAIVEAATASLLFKGDFLSPSSETRITRFTGEDVFVARLNFYAKHYGSFSEFDISVFNTYTKSSGQDPDNEKYVFAMTIENIYSYIRLCRDKRVAKFNGDNRFLNIYDEFLSYTYEKTFLYLFEKYNQLRD